MIRTEMWEDKEGIKIRHTYDTTQYEIDNARERAVAGKGFSKGSLGFGGNLRRVASIPLMEMERLINEGNQDALVAMIGSGKEADAAMRRLIRLHPEWRNSEGAL
jgi:hypothetical protein